MSEVKPATDPLMGMDAQEWAREFLRIWSGRWSEVDEGLMISWFANAIMRGFDEGRRRTDSEKDAEIARLKADQSDWRKGVGYIASVLGLDSLSCVDIAERALEIRADRDRLKAEVEHQRCNDLLCRCCTGRAR